MIMIKNKKDSTGFNKFSSSISLKNFIILIINDLEIKSKEL